MQAFLTVHRILWQVIQCISFKNMFSEHTYMYIHVYVIFILAMDLQIDRNGKNNSDTKEEGKKINTKNKKKYKKMRKGKLTTHYMYNYYFAEMKLDAL